MALRFIAAMSGQADASREATLVILAGGEGSRMGGPKAAIALAGQPVLERLLEQMNWSGPTLLVTAPGREHPPGAEGFAKEAVDPVAGMGPLRGLLTAMEHASTDLLVAVPVDMPGVQREHLVWLVDQLRLQSDVLGLMVERSVDGQRRVEPLPIAMRPEAIDAVQGWLLKHRSVHSLLQCPGFSAVPAPQSWDERVWANLNTPADVDAWERGLDRS